MGEVDFEGRRFRTVRNSSAGESGSETVFHYRQKGAVVWATYHGGGVVFGTLLARATADGHLEMVYQHLNKNGDFRAGRCRARTEVLPTAGTVSTSAGRGRREPRERGARSPRRFRAAGGGSTRPPEPPDSRILPVEDAFVPGAPRPGTVRDRLSQNRRRTRGRAAR